MAATPKEERFIDPWKGWKPTRRKYDPNDPHFDPLHPPEDTPKEVLEAFWGKDEEENGDD